MQFDAQKVLVNVRRAETEDLLDRMTAYRAGMESAALELIEDELASRGVTAEQIAAHAERYRGRCVTDESGAALMCSSCRRPAISGVLGWHFIFGVVPLFPRHFYYCDDHLPERLRDTK